MSLSLYHTLLKLILASIYHLSKLCRDVQWPYSFEKSKEKQAERNESEKEKTGMVLLYYMVVFSWWFIGSRRIFASSKDDQKWYELEWDLTIFDRMYDITALENSSNLMTRLR